MKPRSNSRLKTLSQEQQQKLFEFLRRNSRTDTMAWLAKGALGFPVKTNPASISEFFAWYASATFLRQLVIEQFLKVLGDLDEAQLRTVSREVKKARAENKRSTATT